MFVLDDPFLALILRFVVDTEGTGSTNQEFLERQLKAIKHHLAQYPAEEHGARAMEWIERRAAQFRRDWERNAVASRTLYLRCADCPLAGLGVAEHCEIHEQWLYLLHRYLTEEVTSRDYLEDALALLGQYKERLRHRVASVAEPVAKPRKPKKAKKKKKPKKKKKEEKQKNEKKQKAAS